MSDERKKKIKNYALDLGVEDVGFGAIADYQSPLSPKVDTIFPASAEYGCPRLSGTL